MKTKVKYLKAYIDSKLVINQVKRAYEVRHERFSVISLRDYQASQQIWRLYSDYVPSLHNMHAEV